MSDGFNPYQPQAATRGDSLLPDQRPTTATIFGILNLVFGILAICGNIVGLVIFIVISSKIIDSKTIAEMNLQQFEDPIYLGVMSGQLVLNSILAIVIIISGVGLLKFKPWGRKLANFYAVAYLILLVVGTVVNVYFTVIPALNEANNPGATPDKIGGAIGGVVGGVFGLCFGMAYPICILIFLNRKRFVEQITAR